MIGRGVLLGCVLIAACTRTISDSPAATDGSDTQPSGPASPRLDVTGSEPQTTGSGGSTTSPVGSDGGPSGCGPYPWDEPGPMVEVRIHNQRTEAVFLEGGRCRYGRLEKRNFFAPTEIKANRLDVASCLDAIETGSCGEVNSCIDPRALRLEPGVSYVETWQGLTYNALDPPSGCTPCEPCAIRSRVEGTIDVNVFARASCVGGCTCSLGEDWCRVDGSIDEPIVFEQPPGLPYPSNASAGIDVFIR